MKDTLLAQALQNLEIGRSLEDLARIRAEGGVAASVTTNVHLVVNELSDVVDQPPQEVPLVDVTISSQEFLSGLSCTFNDIPPSDDPCVLAENLKTHIRQHPDSWDDVVVEAVELKNQPIRPRVM